MVDGTHEVVLPLAFAEQRPPHRPPAARAERVPHHGEPPRLVDPVEGGRRHGKIERLRFQRRLFERCDEDLDFLKPLPEIRRQPFVGLDGDDATCTELQQASRHLPRAGAELEHASVLAEPATLDQLLVDLLRMARTSGLVGNGIVAEERPALVPLENFPRHQSHGGGLYTQRPPTIVATTSTHSSSSGGHSSGSRESTTRSARKPGRSFPRRRSSRASQAGATVLACTDSSIVSACSGCQGGCSSIVRSTPARTPTSGSSSSTGASGPFARSAPD